MITASLSRAVKFRRRPVWFGTIGRTRPYGLQWGYDRGTPIDRWYIERFLAAHQADVKGRVLEVKDSGYTDRFGSGLTERGVLDIDAANPHATYVTDLATCDGVPDDHFDCFILTQTLQLVFELQDAVRQVHRILRPGGVVLVTMPVLSRITDPPLMDYWRFTPHAARRLFETVFEPTSVDVSACGNVFSEVAFLQGLAAEDVDERKLRVDDGRFPLVACLRAQKSP